MKDKQGTIIGGCMLLGLGIGFFFLSTSALAFVGCLFAGLGLGLVLATFLSGK